MNNLSSLRPDRYYSTRELAKLFRVNESTIRRWANSRKLKCFRTPGGHRKYTAEHISEFIKKYQYYYYVLSANSNFLRSLEKKG